MEAINLLASSTAHDFNNILAAIMMQAEMSGNSPNMPAEAQVGFQKILSLVEQAAYLTRQLLLFSHRQEPQPRTLNLNDTVSSITKMARRIVGNRTRLQLNLHPTPLMVHADPGMLEQVLLNLIANAHEAMPQGGILTLETTEGNVDAGLASLHQGVRPGPCACFSVSDTGSGIPPEVLPKIFEPQFTTKEPGKSMGLGLSIVFDVIQLHHGLVKVESQPGSGAKFTVFLPANQAGTVSPAPTPKPADLTGTETILLVEDDEELRSLAQAALEQNGYTVIVAGNGLEALRLWSRHQSALALLITDLAMPGGILGHELALHLRQEYPELKIVFISGYSAEFAGAKSELKLGENFLQKPFSADQLLEIIRRSLDS
jgi:CheY-like chemotaxis protein